MYPRAEKSVEMMVYIGTPSVRDTCPTNGPFRTHLLRGEAILMAIVVRIFSGQLHGNASLEVVNRQARNNSKNWQWTTENDGSVRRSTPAPQGVNNHTASSPRQFTALWSTATSVLMIPLTANHRWLRLQWAHEHRARQADWHQLNHAPICGTMRAAFMLEAMLVNSAFQSIRGAFFQQDNASPHGCKDWSRLLLSLTHGLFCFAYSSDMSLIEYVWDLVGRRLARDPRPRASKDELLLRIQAIWNSLPQADI
ncbi:transposable element Tcb2 transposase [Trichonephila clavipes]|nr:transposable element Tcb2 transposase [Trichonephila clavipes]